MPAQRSRTLNWRHCLEQLHERNGALEIAVARDYDHEGGGRHLIWRVRILNLTEREIVVERPSVLGQAIPLRDGVELVAVIAIGQNRWMFRTNILGAISQPLNDHKTLAALRLAVPEVVERCQRRGYYRIETAALSLPEVSLWPLLDPKSVLPAERANELRFADDDADSPFPRAAVSANGEEMLLPEVGPRFPAQLINLGGGGVGLRLRQEDSQPLNHHKIFWMRFALPPELDTPICVSAKVVHTHLESTQHLYAGMAFDFSFNPVHQQLVVDQICRFIARQQRAQLQRTATLAATLQGAAAKPVASVRRIA